MILIGVLKVPETSIVDGNIYITTGSVSGNTITHDTNKLVKIHSSKIEYNFVNEIKIRPLPETKGTTGEETETQIVDIKLITESITITGVLDDEAAESSFTKEQNLIAFGKYDRELTVVWGTTPYQTLWKPDNDNKKHGVFIQKMSIPETAGIIGEAVTTDPSGGSTAQAETNRAITIILVRGKDI